MLMLDFSFGTASVRVSELAGLLFDIDMNAAPVVHIFKSKIKYLLV
jgi:hypothetical protein